MKSLESLKKNFAALSKTEQKVINFIERRNHIVQDPRIRQEEEASFGQRLADKVATFGGSWTFILIFLTLISLWLLWNSAVLGKPTDVFDPFPFILLNLFLSFLATLQAPIILMAQKRQDDKDRIAAAHDYEVNLKAELEIMSLHDKVDDLIVRQWEELLALQAKQIELLAAIKQDLPTKSS